ncbi:MAG: GDSL-type esterase/lipase family protein [Clostridiales bacterium]|nr:GDSL-type esterase/lipase family protein [Clostridiales bacterium]
MKTKQTRFNKLTLPVFLLALVMALGFAIPMGEANASAAEQGRQFTMVVLGDSIAAGYSAPAGQGYAALVAGDQNITVLNYAVGGWRTEHVINQLLTDAEVQEAIRNADAIQIAIGGNDLQQTGLVGPAVNGIVNGDNSLWEQHCENIAGRFAQIVELVCELNPDAPFFVFNSYTPDYKRFGALPIGSTIGANPSITGNQLYALAQNYAIPRFNETYAAYLEENPGAFILVDIFDAFPGNASSYYGTLIDMIHPSAAGHAKLAERLNAAIDAYNAEQMQVTPVATVEKLNGNKNLLTVTVTETFPLKSANTVELSFLIDNNAAGFYEVGGYTVYVDTKGNTQIRACYIAA